MNYLYAPVGPIKLRYPLPENWDEMTTRQFRRIVRFSTNRFEKPEIGDVMLVKAMTGANNTLFYFFDQSVIVFQALPLVEWAKGENVHTTSLVPHLRTKFGRKLIGPSDKLGGVNVLAFGYATAWLNAFSANPTEENLNCFIASLYHPRKLPFKKAKPFDGGAGWERDYKLASHVRFEDKLMAAISFRGMLAAMPSIYKVTYEEHTKQGIEVEWEVTVMGFAGEMPWEKSKIEEMEFTSIMAWIEAKHVAAKEMKRKMEMQK
jgi:hypothetical protein